MSIFEQFQQQAADRLLALPFFDDIEVLSVHEKEVDSKIDIALAKIGIGVLVAVVGCKQNAQSGSGIPQFDSIWIVQVTENPILNTIGKNAIEVCENVILGLHGWAVEGFSGQTSCADDSFHLLPTPDDDGNRIYEAKFRTHLAIHQDPLPVVADPVIESSAGTVTITSSTPGAAVFYTVDGKHPSPRKTLYTAPFSASGVTVKARAWLAGYQTSQVSLTT